MAWQVAWTETAWNDVEAVADHIAKDSRQYAVAFVKEVREAASSLADFAQRGHVVPEFNQPDIRELFVGSYRLIYQVSERDVYVLGLIHGSRDLWML